MHAAVLCLVLEEVVSNTIPITELRQLHSFSNLMVAFAIKLPVESSERCGNDGTPIIVGFKIT